MKLIQEVHFDNKNILLNIILCFVVFLAHFILFYLINSLNMVPHKSVSLEFEMVDVGGFFGENNGESNELGDNKASKPESVPSPPQIEKVKPVVVKKKIKAKTKEILVAKNTKSDFSVSSKNKKTPEPSNNQVSANTDSIVNTNSSNITGVASGSGSGGNKSGFSRGGYISRPDPIYPSASLRMGEEGTVRLKVKVLSDGTLADVKIVKKSGYARLDEAALQTVKKKYRFKPDSVNGVPQISEFEFNIDFVLKD